MKAALGELKRRVRGKRLAAIGFCFGGGMVWNLLASGEPRLSAAAPFYGPFPTGGDLRGSRKAAVLGVYARARHRINATRDAAQAALEAARLRHEILTFPGPTTRSSTTRTPALQRAAAAEAYRRDGRTGSTSSSPETAEGTTATATDRERYARASRPAAATVSSSHSTSIGLVG